MSHVFSWDLFNSIPMVGILRNIPADKVGRIASLYAEAGLSTLEITMNSAGAAETIAELSNSFGKNLNIGAGTVCTMQDLETAIKAGATFIVTPILNEDVVAACVQQQVPIFPGAYTPSEIYRASSLGASMVKVFPATKLGASYIKDILAPLPFLKLVPTGGIGLENFQEYLKAGAKGLGIGSTLFPHHLIAEDNWTALKELFSSFVLKYNEYIHP